MTPPRRLGSARGGFSYLELVLAMAILAICIIPAARMLPTLLAGQRGLETRYQLSLVAQEKLEEAVLSLQNDFGDAYYWGSLGDRGQPNLHYVVDVDVSAAAGGRYATVRVEAWVDTDGNGWDDDDPDDGEPVVRFDTLVANRQWSP